MSCLRVFLLDLRLNTEQSRGVKKKSIELIATVGFIGRIPWAPGTFGSVIGVFFAIGLSYANWFVYIGALFAIIALGIWSAGAYEKATGRHDPKEVVIDEVAGYLLTVLWVPPTVQNLFIGFLLFRLFDIWKPFPISWIDKKVPGGFGTIADDLAAGFAGFLLMHLLVSRLSFYF